MNKKKNVVLIIADDLGYWALGCYGNSDVISPNIDYLANNGKKFNNFFCVSPVCSPARASLYTGRIPSQHGIHDWLNEWYQGNTTENYLKDQLTFVDILSNTGYNCALSGKWHLGYSEKAQHGFKWWYCHQKGGGPYYNAPVYKNGKLVYEKEYITDVITDNALNFLDELVQEEKPFFISINYTAPHSPWDKDNHPQNILDLYKECKFKSCPRDSYHPWKTLKTFEGNEEERLEVLKGYFAAVTAMDNNIGRVMDFLNEKNILENTIVIFTGDNGMNMGHHGIFGKGNGTSPLNMYDTSVKVPFIIYEKGKASKEIDNMLSHYDFRHTLLDYLGIEDTKEDNINYPGKSFVDILTKNSFILDENVIIYDEYGPTRMIRNKEYKYIHRYPDGPYEFYNLLNDPDEKINEYDNEFYFEKIQEMRNKLEDWFLKYVNPEIDGSKLPVYGGGQRTLAGKWGKYSRNAFGKYDTRFIFTSDNKTINNKED